MDFEFAILDFIATLHTDIAGCHPACDILIWKCRYRLDYPVCCSAADAPLSQSGTNHGAGVDFLPAYRQCHFKTTDCPRQTLQLFS